MKYIYQTKGVCPKAISVELDSDKIINVEFLNGGCPGNLQAVPRLVKGMRVSEVKEKLSGIKCGLKATSCADQLVHALEEALAQEKQTIKN